MKKLVQLESDSISKKEFLRLKEAINRIISLNDPDHILDTILAEVIGLVKAERGFIALTNDRDEIRIDAGVSHNISLPQADVQETIFYSIVRQAIQTRENVFLPDSEDEDTSASDGTSELEAKAVMCSPLLFDNKLRGILYVDSGAQALGFNELDRFFFTMLSDQAAIAIENVKLYTQVQASNQKLRTKIEESETRYRQLVEFSPEAIAVHSEGKLVFVNPAAVKLLGAKGPEDLLGKPVFEMVHPDFRDIVEARIHQQEQGQPVPPLEERFLRLDGSTVDVEVAAVPFTYQGKLAMQVIFRDITNRKRMEQELLRAQKLESVGVLAGGIAHDFNNILQVIRGNALMAKATPDDKDNLDLCLTAVERAVVHAISLTSQLLTFARGGTPITRATSIKALIEETVAFALRGSNVAYTLDFAGDLHYVEVDSDQINQVIHNLILNANQAMPGGGTITISASNVMVTKEDKFGLGLKKGGYVKVSIKDHGIGMSEETLQNIFDPYFTTKAGGSGLGLASSYSIITRHGGIIEAESEERRGSTFTIYLPVSRKQPQRSEIGKYEDKLNGRVLLMDDDKMVRDTAARMLRVIGCEVEVVVDGAEAIERYLAAEEAGQPFDLVIFDLTVPGGMGGKEAIKKLRQHDPDIKAIVASGYSHDRVMANPKEYGFQGVISKPFNLDALVKTMKELL